MLILLLLTLLALGTPVHADVSADSLGIALKTADLAPDRQLAFLQAETNRTLGQDPRLALALTRLAADLADQLDDEEGRYRAHLTMGIALYCLGDYAKALREYETALAMARGMGARILEGNALNNIGILYFVWGEHDRALDYYLENLTIQLEKDNAAGAAQCYNNIAGIQQSAGKYDEALDNYRQALGLYRQIGEVTFEASTLNNIGLVLYEMGDNDQALVNLEAALALEREKGDLTGEALSLTNMGRVRIDQGRHAEARQLLEQALAIRRDIGDRSGESVNLQLLGSLLVEDGQASAGIVMLDSALRLAGELGVQELVSDDLLALSEAHESLGRFDLALDYHRRYKEARDLIFDEERTRAMSAAQSRFEADLKDQEIQNLKQEAEFETYRRKILMIGAGLSLVIIVLLLNRYRIQRKANAEIQAKNEELGRAHARLEKAAREELAHVTRVATMGELAAAFAHELNQPLAAIKANARAARNIMSQPAADQREVGEALVDIRDDAERATEIIRHLRDMMRKGEERREPHDLNEIIRAAAGFVAGSARRQGVDLQLELAAGLPPVLCDQIQIQQVIVNLVQNSLAALEGRRGRVVVRASHPADDTVKVEVSDDGPGAGPDILAEMFDPFFTTKTEGLGMGLPICRSLVRAHGGDLVAGRNEEAGLTVGFTLPVGALPD